MISESSTQKTVDKGQIRKWWLGRLPWSLWLLCQLALYLFYSETIWAAKGLSWLTWVTASVALPMLAIRRSLPPSVLASNARLLFTTSTALTLAAGLTTGYSPSCC